MTTGDDDLEPIDAEIVEPVGTPDFTPTVQAPSFADVTGYTEAGVPTFDHVRDKIEKRTTTAIGSQELSEMGRESTALDEAIAKRDEAAKKKLEEMRKSLGL
ncbi:hypothetical protein JVX90_09645 [Gordonia sp. PDNC005]|uniref:hypothetical protein n=1 Tax=unclassified Gordonia (in: high G+C Gram-positive bacteria) TaxID=2657482 RepID=UPI0019636B74|nr:hypothetical protein [Gordonia sp. PDNC005]QRY64400.1 hypothetical protein JVX90_09645 [Gordonia sp. PDNC005]